MKKLVIFVFLLATIAAEAQDCTDESKLKEPGRFLDAHTGLGLRGTGYTPSEIVNARKLLTAFEEICKKSLVFTGGQAKASFSLNTKEHYNRHAAPGAMYNLGFHAFACNIQTHKLAIVDEYQDVLRVTSNPRFERAFAFLDLNDPVYRSPLYSKDLYAPYIDIFNYYAFTSVKIVDAINNGKGFTEMNDEHIAINTFLLENRPGKGYGYNSGSGFVAQGNLSFIYRHCYLTHTDLPFLIPVTRKKFLEDLLEFYDREKLASIAKFNDKIKTQKGYIADAEKNNDRSLPKEKERLAQSESDQNEMLTVNEKKKAFAQDLLRTRDTTWLNQQAAIERENRTFTIPNDPKKYLGDIYGQLYIKEFYTGNEGLKLYRVNPEYLKKYPPDGPKPSLIKIMYRLKGTEPFGNIVNDSFINKLDLEGFRKLLN